MCRGTDGTGVPVRPGEASEGHGKYGGKVRTREAKIMTPPEDSLFYGRPGCRDPYRYWLHRDIGTDERRVLFIMLNPSDALSLGSPDTPADNDQTVTRCIDFARSWRCRDLTVVNLFASRSACTDDLLKDPTGSIGEHNDAAIEWAIQSIHDADNGRVVCAWGDLGILCCRNCYVLDKLTCLGIDAYCFGLTDKKRHPKHPSRLSGDTEIVPLPIG